MQRANRERSAVARRPRSGAATTKLPPTDARQPGSGASYRRDADGSWRRRSVRHPRKRAGLQGLGDQGAYPRASSSGWGARTSQRARAHRFCPRRLAVAGTIIIVGLPRPRRHGRARQAPPDRVRGHDCQCRLNFPQKRRSKSPQISRSGCRGEVPIFWRPAAGSRRSALDGRGDGGFRSKVFGHQCGVLA